MTAGDRMTARQMPPPSCFGQKNNNQLATGVAKVGGGRQESIDNHMATTMGNNVSVQWMIEQGGG
jgi:hypothetical protein